MTLHFAERKRYASCGREDRYSLKREDVQSLERETMDNIRIELETRNKQFKMNVMS